MLSYLTQQKLADFIISIAEGERQLDICRQILAKTIHFEPYTAFRRIDRLNKGFINIHDISNFLLENKSYLTTSEVSTISRTLDTTQTGTINLTEFQDAILPKFDPVLKQIVTSRSTYYVGPDQILEFEIEIGMTRFFEQIAKNYANYNMVKSELKSSYDFNVRDAFDTVDVTKKGFLDIQNIEYFLLERKKPISVNEIAGFIAYGDPENTSVLTLRQFMNILSIGATGQYSSPLKASILNSSGLKNTQYVSQRVASPLKASTYLSNKIASPLKTSYLSPSRQQLRNSGYLSPNRSQIIPPQSLKDTYSPGGSKIQQSHIVNSIQKNQDDVKYQEYLERSRQRSIEKTYQNSYTKQYSPKTSVYQPTSPQRSMIIEQNNVSPLKGNEEEFLMGMIKSVIQFEREIQQLISDISLKSDFNLQDSFRLFDQNSNGNITKFEFEKGLNKLGLFPTYNQLHLIFQQYDKEQKGYLSYSDFSQLFYTPNSHQIDLINSRIPKFIEPLEGENQYDLFNFDTLRLFKKIFETKFQSEQAIDNMKQQLQNRRLFNLYDAFRSLDLEGDGVITYEELKEMLYCYGIYTSENDMISLFKRFDKNQQGEIRYSEFVNEMSPKSPIKKY